jgi:hypothetical protein
MDTTVLVQNLTDEKLKECIPIFIHEVRRVDGEKFPTNSLVSIVAGLQQTIGEVRRVDFFRGEAFEIVTKSLDAAMKIAAKEGRALRRKSAETISYEDEEKLWAKVLGSSSPKQLIRTLFYLNGLHFALRGGEEHSELSISQFSVQERDGKKCLVYRETVSKTNPGGLRTARVQPKEVVHFEYSLHPDRCHVCVPSASRQLAFLSAAFLWLWRCVVHQSTDWEKQFVQVHRRDVRRGWSRRSQDQPQFESDVRNSTVSGWYRRTADYGANRTSKRGGSKVLQANI